MEDIGTLIFVILAAAMSIYSSYAKKKAAAQKKAVAQPATPEAPAPSEPQTLEDMMRKFMGGEPIDSHGMPAHDDEGIDRDNEEETRPEYEPIEAEHAEHTTVEYHTYEPDPVVETVMESELYPTAHPQPLDSLGSLGHFKYSTADSEVHGSMEEGGVRTEDTITVSEVGSDSEGFHIEEFDPLKAVIYAEIISPKYI